VAIAASLCFSLGFLPAALCIIGPDSDTGSIMPCLRAVGLGCIFDSEGEETARGAKELARSKGAGSERGVEVQGGPVAETV